MLSIALLAAAAVPTLDLPREFRFDNVQAHYQRTIEADGTLRLHGYYIERRRKIPFDYRVTGRTVLAKVDGARFEFAVPLPR